jgi:hypothetical protein
MKLNQTKTLYDYWNTLRAGQPAPARQDIEPSAIARVLGDTFILERRPGNRFRFRLAGTRVGELFGFEPKGSDILQYWPEHDVEAIQSLLYSVTQDCAAALIGFTLKTEEGYTTSGEMIALPLKHLDGTVSRIIGTMSLSSPPYWLGMQRLSSLEISSLRLIWPDDAPRFMQEVGSDAIITPFPASAGFGQKPSGRRVAHLTVYDGGQNNQ